MPFYHQIDPLQQGQELGVTQGALSRAGSAQGRELALLEALANPADPVATLAVVRSPLGGADDASLAAYRLR